LASRSSQAITAALQLSTAVDGLTFSSPVTHVYNPLNYAWEAHQKYLGFIPARGTRVLFLGMNPGPWGMAQTGVPFGQIAAVRDWLGIKANIRRPSNEHPKRPIEGLACKRSEVSGERLWGLFQTKFKTPKDFFVEHFVTNYCPLVFMEASAKNRTPDKLPACDKKGLDQACDEHLSQLIRILNPEWLVGVGAFAEDCFRRVAAPTAKITRILHPSPASPAANRGWAKLASEQLSAAGIW
jgi:single-strand selective monofunctional uracil DNA glycosylase